VSACTQPAQATIHQRHRPERTVLHALLREHLDAFIRYADEHYTRPLPAYVRRAFEGYLRCGIRRTLVACDEAIPATGAADTPNHHHRDPATHDIAMDDHLEPPVYAELPDDTALANGPTSTTANSPTTPRPIPSMPFAPTTTTAPIHPRHPLARRPSHSPRFWSHEARAMPRVLLPRSRERHDRDRFMTSARWAARP